MSSGKTHLIASLVLDAALVYVGYEALKLGQFDITEGIVWGALGGTFITPDYDLEGVTITEGLIKKLPVFGEIWVAMWYPYALLNPHRGRSHTIIGTLERQSYFLLLIELTLIFVVGLQYVTTGQVSLDVNYLKLSYLPEIKVTFVISFVWFLHDLLHYIFDT